MFKRIILMSLALIFMIFYKKKHISGERKKCRRFHCSAFKFLIGYRSQLTTTNQREFLQNYKIYLKKNQDGQVQEKSDNNRYQIQLWQIISFYR